MTSPEIEFLEMELAWVRSVRKGRRLDLVRPALVRETQIEAELAQVRGHENVLPMAANFAERTEDPGKREGGR